MFKKVLAILMVMVLMAGCSSTSEPSSSAGSTSSSTETTASSDTSSNDTSVSDSKDEEKPSTELTLVFADGDAKAKEAIYSIVDSFNSSQSNFFVTIEPGVGGAYDEFLKTKESVGDFPDIVEMRDTGVYYRAGLIEPISAELQSLFKTTTKFGGEVYTAPMAGEGTQGIIYNKTYFQENGLNEAPATWDEFLDLCQQIQELGDMSPIVVGGNDIWHIGFWFNKIYTDNVVMENPDFITELYAGENSWVDEASARATFEDMQDLFQYVDEGWGSTPDAMITTFLVSDMAAMMYSGTWMFTQIEEADPSFEFGWFPVPDKNGHTNLIGGAGKGGWSISSEAAQDPDKLAGFEAFVQYFFDEDVYGEYLSALSFFPTTVISPKMEVSDKLELVIDAVNEADSLNKMWNGEVGDKELPPDFRNFTYKTAIEVLGGTRTIDSALEELDSTWQTSIEYFNPVTGVGIE